MRQDGTFTGSSGGKANGNPVIKEKPIKGNFLYNVITGEYPERDTSDMKRFIKAICSYIESDSIYNDDEQRASGMGAVLWRLRHQKRRGNHCRYDGRHRGFHGQR